MKLSENQDLDEVTIRIAGVVRESIVDGPGIRFVVFCQGCPHGCRGCHNPDTHDFSGGYDCSVPVILREVDKNPLLSGVTFSGGEPACQSRGFSVLAEELKKRDLNIMMYSGFTYEELLEKAKTEEYMARLIGNIDYLVDGPFIEEEKDLTLSFRGSRNQNIVDISKSRELGKKVVTEL